MKAKKINGWLITKSTIPTRYNITAVIKIKTKIIGWKKAKKFCNENIPVVTIVKEEAKEIYCD